MFLVESSEFPVWCYTNVLATRGLFVVSFSCRVCRLFQKVDKDHTGFLEGSEYQEFVKGLTKYMQKKFHDLGCEFLIPLCSLH